MVTDIFHHPIELQSQVARHVKRAQIVLNNVGIPITESTDNGLFRQLAMIHKQIFLAKLQKKYHFNLIFSEKRLQRDKRRLKQSIHHLKMYNYENE